MVLKKLDLKRQQICINNPKNIMAKNKLAPHGTDGRLFTTDVSVNFSHVTQKLSKNNKYGLNKVRFCALV